MDRVALTARGFIPAGAAALLLAAIVSLWQLGLALLVAVPFVRAQAHPERPSDNGAAAP